MNRPPPGTPDRYVVRIQDVDPEGRGRARWEGRTALVSQALPGELVAFRIDRETAGTVQGRVRELREASPDRIAHSCRHEHHCTGCPLLALAPDAEAAFKTARIREALAPLGSDVLATLFPLRVPAGPFAYRYLGKREAAWDGRRVILGSFVAGTHRVTDNRGCPVLEPRLSGLFDALAGHLTARSVRIHDGPGRPGLRHAVARLSRATGRAILVLVTSEPGCAEAGAALRSFADAHPAIQSGWIIERTDGGNAILSGAARHVSGEDTIEDELLGFRYRIGPRTFFQVNPVAAEELFRAALELAGHGTSAVEFHAGAGALSLPLSRQFTAVTAVEVSAESTATAAANVALNGCAGISIVHGDADLLAAATLRQASPAAVVLDPPRKGAGPHLLGLIAESTADRIVLLSCDPDALARDAAALAPRGWMPDAIVPVDQFPRTAHVETATRFVRRP